MINISNFNKKTIEGGIRTKQKLWNERIQKDFEELCKLDKRHCK